MPLDSSTYDQSTLALTDARALLVEKGWCRGVLTDDAGRHCLIGAILDVTGISIVDLVMMGVNDMLTRTITRIAAVLPVHDRRPHYWGDLARFNNEQTSVEPVLALIDAALAEKCVLGLCST